MKNELEDRTRATFISRRKWLRSAGATGAGVLSAGLVTTGARGSANKAAQVVLPTTTQDVTAALLLERGFQRWSLRRARATGAVRRRVAQQLRAITLSGRGHA
jgi:hypothetical protein